MFTDKRKSPWGKIIIVAFVFVLIYGYSLSDSMKDFYSRNTPDKDKEQNEISTEDNEAKNNKGTDSSASANYPQNMIGDNDKTQKISMYTKIRLKSYDSHTNEVLTNEIAVPSSLINMTLEEAEAFIQSNYRNWVVSAIDEEYIEIYESGVIENANDDPNPIPGDESYYLIKEENGRIYIFKYSSNNVMESKKETAINYNLIAEVDQQLFRNGIKKYTEDEVYELLQDFES